MSVVLVFDCETTGLLPKKKGDAFPFITQLSFAMYNMAEKELVQVFDHYVYVPKEVEIPEVVTKLTGISRELIDKEGMGIVFALDAFYQAISKANFIVAHNMDFDYTVLLAAAAKVHPELERILYSRIPSAFVCTMKKGMDLCKLERTNSRGVYYKYPTLAELYTHLFGYVPQNLHDARMDVLCCLRCFLKMVKDYDVPEMVFLEWVGPTPTACLWC